MKYIDYIWFVKRMPNSKHIWYYRSYQYILLTCIHWTKIIYYLNNDVKKMLATTAVQHLMRCYVCYEFSLSYWYELHRDEFCCISFILDYFLKCNKMITWFRIVYVRVIMHMKMRFTSVIIFNTENASRFLFCSFKAVNKQ